MAKLNIAKHFKIEKDAIYVLKLNRQPSLDEIRVLQDQFENTFKQYGARFIILGQQYEMINPTALLDSPTFPDLLDAAITRWAQRVERERGRIVITDASSVRST